MTTLTKAALYLPKAERPRERSLRPAPNHFSVLYSYTPAVQTICVSDTTRRSKPSEFLLCAGLEGLLLHGNTRKIAGLFGYTQVDNNLLCINHHSPPRHFEGCDQGGPKLVVMLAEKSLKIPPNQAPLQTPAPAGSRGWRGH